MDVDKSGVIEYGEFKQVRTRDRRAANASVLEQRLRSVPPYFRSFVMVQVELPGPDT